MALFSVLQRYVHFGHVCSGWYIIICLQRGTASLIYLAKIYHLGRFFFVLILFWNAVVCQKFFQSKVSYLGSRDYFYTK